MEEELPTCKGLLLGKPNLARSVCVRIHLFADQIGQQGLPYSQFRMSRDCRAFSSSRKEAQKNNMLIVCSLGRIGHGDDEWLISAHMFVIVACTNLRIVLECGRKAWKSTVASQGVP